MTNRDLSTAIAAYLAKHPRASDKQCAAAVGCHPSTVYAYRHAVKRNKIVLRDGVMVARVPGNYDGTGYMPVSLPAFPWGEK